ncbi:MAG TPA: hypothetical protein VGW34_10010 [Allosphingosinicella sp.]|nr:hypothetical protein [Allosphingosinicella sp.]
MGLETEGGAAAALAGAGGSGSGTGGEGGDGGQSGQGGGDAAAAAAAAAAAGGGDGGGAGPDFLDKLSADPRDGGKPSNRDWVVAKGWKSLDDVIASAYEAERAISDGGRIKVPGEGAKPEEVDAFHKAIGRPDSAGKYEFALPDGISQDHLDMDLVTPLREIAFKAGTPAGAFKAMAEGLVAHQLDQMKAAASAEDADYAAKMKEWGDQADAKMADVNGALRGLGLKPADFAAIQRGFQIQFGKPGSGKALDLFQKIGAGMAEDAVHGGGKGRFGITGAEAQAEIDKLIVDTEFQNKLIAKDPAAVARWDRLNGAVAADRDRKAQAAG